MSRVRRLWEGIRRPFGGFFAWSRKQQIAIAILLGLAVGAHAGGGLVFWLKDEHSAKQPLPDRERAFAPLPPGEAGRLAEMFRPWLRFDSGERWRPLSIRALLSERIDGRPANRFCTRSQSGPKCSGLGSVAQLEAKIEKSGALGNTSYIDIAGTKIGDYRSPSCHQPGLQDCDDSGSAIYYRATESNDRVYLDYWWFFRFNHFPGAGVTCHFKTEACDEHEGDWEGVTLVTQPGHHARLDYVVYAAHKGTFRYPASQLVLHDKRRPEVFVANGSHASYPKACHSPCSQPLALVGLVDLPEASTDGEDAWGRNEKPCKPRAPGSCLLPLPTAEPGHSTWTTWPGLWGATCGERCRADGRPQSPASPGLQTRFQAPWCSTQEGSLSCDRAAQGCGDWFGPLVAGLACNPKGVASDLSATEKLPSGPLSMTVTTKDGTRRPISATTRGIVQALGKPLHDGDAITIGGGAKTTEVIVRAEGDRRLLEARFDPFLGGGTGQTLTVTAGLSSSGVPVLHATREGVRVPPVERRRLSLAPVG